MQTRRTTQTRRTRRTTKTMKTLSLFLLLLATPALADTAPAPSADALPTAKELLDLIDSQMVFETRTSKVTMTVVNNRRTRVMSMVTQGRGETDSAIEYVDPPREKGTRMLKLGDELWMYMPSVDRTQKISGHMLRQGMMGSDVSYEDLMASQSMDEMYRAEVTGKGEVDGRPCWTVSLTANDDSVAYPKRTMWVDTETYIPLQQELFALSGMKLKTWTMSDVKDFDGRKFPTRMVITDHLKKDSSTTLEFSDMKFGVDLESEVFSMRWLERR